MVTYSTQQIGLNKHAPSKQAINLDKATAGAASSSNRFRLAIQSSIGVRTGSR
jgi:hypothetical protein